MASSTVFAVTARRCISINSSRSSSRTCSRFVSTTSVLNSAEMHPNYGIDSIKPPKYWGKPADVEEDPNHYHRKPVSSAHAIDLTSNPPKLSAKDSVAISPDGTVVHGRYGELKSISSSSGIPLEYLALLHPAAEGVSAVNQLTKDTPSGTGTLLIYGATQPAGLAALQLASASSIPVIGVVDGTHSAQHEFVDSIKNLTIEPGTVLPEETACIKSLFRDLVHGATHGDSANDMTSYDANTFTRDFRETVLEYVQYFPNTKLSPDASEYEFDGKEKDRTHHEVNITAYLSQFDKGAPEIDPVVLKEAFTTEQYAIFKNKFHTQTTAIISGDDENLKKEFNPADIVRDMSQRPESIATELPNAKGVKKGGDYVPYEFTPLTNCLQNGVEVPVGGPVLGAVVAVTNDLSVAVEAVANAKTLREKAEALQFLTDGQKNAYAGFSSVVGMAKEAGKPVVVVGGTLPNLPSVEPSSKDVEEAISAMALDNGTSSLNYFLQIYRASDYPVYADYAIHRAMEPLSGPRQIVVTK